LNPTASCPWPTFVFVREGNHYRVGKAIRDLCTFARHNVVAIRHSREDTFLIAVSGYGREEHHRLSREAGFDLHLVKPAHAAKVVPPSSPNMGALTSIITAVVVISALDLGRAVLIPITRAIFLSCCAV
jgi:hypothetical protein